MRCGAVFTLSKSCGAVRCGAVSFFPPQRCGAVRVIFFKNQSYGAVRCGCPLTVISYGAVERAP